MFVFICPNGHKSYSAAKEQHAPECPKCSEPTQLVAEENA